MSEPKVRPRRRRWVIGLALVAGLLTFLLMRSRSPQPKQKPPGRPPVSVSLVPVGRQDVEVWLEGLGTVTPIATVVVRSRVDGQLADVLFEEGQIVHVGDPLAQIDPRPFQIAVAQASGLLARDAANAQNNQLNLERLNGLLEEKLIARQQVDNQRALVRQDRGSLAVDRAQLANAKLQLEWARVVSPVDGIAGIRQVDKGNLVHSTDPTGLVVITQLDPISVVFTLSQDVLPQVSEQMHRGPLTVEAYARDGSTLLSRGTLQVIDNQVNGTTGTIRLKARVPNADQRLWPNAFVKARLQLQRLERVLVVPTVAVQRGPNGTFVYVAKPDGTAAMGPVKLGATEGQLTVVTAGLVEGQQVVVDGQNQLSPGVRMLPRSIDGGSPGGGRGSTPEGRPGADGGQPNGPSDGGDSAPVGVR